VKRKERGSHFAEGDETEQRVKIARLTEAQLTTVQDLEAELGTWVVAAEPQFRLAELTDAHLGNSRSWRGNWA